jgi:uncharacterized membrane protein YczE
MTLAATADTPVLRRLATLAVGLATVATGVALMIRAELGVAPWDVLTTGIAEASGLEIGFAAMLLPLVFTGLGWALGRPPGPGTVIAVLVVGPMLGAVLELVPEQSAMAPRLGLFALGFLLVAAGITAVIVAEIGPGPAEIVMLAINDKGVPLARARTGIELACVALGWVLGGQIGAGTLLVALTIGPVLRWMLTRAGYRSAVAEDRADCAAPGA